MVTYLPPSGYRLPQQVYRKVAYSSLQYLPAMVGKLRAFMPATSGIVTIVSPFNGQFEAQGVPFVVTATVPVGSAPILTFGAQAPVAMSVSGTTATATVTPGAGDVGVATSLKVAIPSSSVTIALDVEANLGFWLDAADPTTFTQTSGNLTGVKSKVTGTLMNAVTGTPKIITDPRDNKPAFASEGGSWILGSDAAMIAAATGTNKPFTIVSVYEPADCQANGNSLSCNVAAGSDGLYIGQVNPKFNVGQGGSGGFANAASENTQAGLSVVVQHTADALTVKTSINGGVESSVVVAAHGAATPDRVGFFGNAGFTPGSPWIGTLREQLFFGVDKTPTQIAAIVNAMLVKWRPPPVCQFIGDSITTAQLATNGGMVNQLLVSLRAIGLNLDPQGPVALNNGSGGQNFFPLRISAFSGDTCAVMNARVTSNTTGLGKGGSSLGFYQRTKLALLFAGTNGMNTTDYTTLLNNIYTLMLQGQPSFKIAVTPITNIIGLESAVAAFNLALVGIWDAFEAAHPGILIRWNAYLALPNPPGNPNYVDGTHPNAAGYVTLVNHPTYGLFQAVKGYIASIQ